MRIKMAFGDSSEDNGGTNRKNAIKANEEDDENGDCDDKDSEK